MAGTLPAAMSRAERPPGPHGPADRPRTALRRRPASALRGRHSGGRPSGPVRDGPCRRRRAPSSALFVRGHPRLAGVPSARQGGGRGDAGAHDHADRRHGVEPGAPGHRFPTAASPGGPRSSSPEEWGSHPSSCFCRRLAEAGTTALVLLGGRSEPDLYLMDLFERFGMEVRAGHGGRQCRTPRHGDGSSRCRACRCRLPSTLFLRSDRDAPPGRRDLAGCRHSPPGLHRAADGLRDGLLPRMRGLGGARHRRPARVPPELHRGTGLRFGADRVGSGPSPRCEAGPADSRPRNRTDRGGGGPDRRAGRPAPPHAAHRPRRAPSATATSTTGWWTTSASERSRRRGCTSNPAPVARRPASGRPRREC